MKQPPEISRPLKGAAAKAQAGQLPTIQRDRRPTGIWSEIIAGALSALVIFAYCVSFGSLIFAGPLESHVDLAVVAALGSAALATVLNALFGSFRFGVVAPDTPVIALIGTLAASVAADAAHLSDMAMLSHGIAVFIICSAVTGATLLFVGAFKLSRWVRFVPYTVIAAFLAASGWFLVVGALEMSSGKALRAIPQELVNGASVPTLGAAVGVALLLWITLRLSRSALSTPMAVLAGLAAAAIYVHAFDADIALLRAEGWLFPTAAGEAPLILPMLVIAQTPPDLSRFISSLPEILTIAGVATMAILLNSAGLEAQTGHDADLDREYCVNGTANLALAAVGGLPSNLSLNRSYMSYIAGGRTGVTAAAAAIGCIAIAGLAQPLAAIAPRPLLAGMLLFMGVNMLRAWLVDTIRQFGPADWLTSVAIFALIVSFGYVEGAVLGVVAACLSFAFRYGLTPFVRLSMTRADCRSYVERPPRQEAFLSAEGERVRVYRLQGYLYFGSAHRVSSMVREAVDKAKAPVSCVLLDFHFVTGIDASADASFERLCRRLRERGVRVCFTDLADAPWANGIRRRLQNDPNGQAVLATLDAGLEWCEDHILRNLKTEIGALRPVTQWLSDELGPALSAELLLRLKHHTALAGETICQQGDPANTIIFVDAGRISVLLELGGGSPLLLKTMLGETVIGEIGFFKRLPRSASVVAETDAAYFEIDRESFEALKSEAPEACAALQELILRIISDRLVFANRELAVQRR